MRDSILEKIAEAQSVNAVFQAFKNFKKEKKLDIGKAEGSLAAFILARFTREIKGTRLIVVPDALAADELAADMRALGISVSVFAGWDSIAYYRPLTAFSPSFGARARVLCDIVRGNAKTIIASQRAFLTPLPPPSYMYSLPLMLKIGDRLDPIKTAEKLVDFGYTKVYKVQDYGEFAVRGEVFDIFPYGEYGEEEAYRILCDFDIIESIKRFNPSDQSGGEKADSTVLYPLKETVWDDKRIEALSRNLEGFDEFTENGRRAIIEEIFRKKTASGEEMLFPLAFEKPSTLLDYMDFCGNGSDGAAFFIDKEKMLNADESFAREYEGLYAKARREREVPKPERVLLKFADLYARANNSVSFLSVKTSFESGIDDSSPSSISPISPIFSIKAEPPRSFFGNIDYLKEEFANLVKNGWEIVIAAESEPQARRIESVLIGKDGKPVFADRVFIEILPLSSGFSLPESKFMLAQENEIFGRAGHNRKRVHSLKTARSVAIETFVDLNPEDYIVHLNYGIGIFKGIDRIRALGHERDYIKLEYADEEVIFVPIEQVNLVQRYIGNQGDAPKLDKIGSKAWESRKNKAKKSAEELAERLIDLYSKRKASVGFAFPPDTEWQALFEAGFPFEETEDQLRCVEEIKADMENPAPMDRLVCGDVGYGKTEVAVRACFKAVMAGKQTAFLAPTTILAEQHYENLLERFERFPVKIAMLSRLVEQKKAKKILEETASGEIDVLIGTHRIIQKDVVFKNLGLIVVDEEQRFGVKDKERLKELKNNVDCLTLSATPIPRTLHMSLLKIRDMSLLATPPRNRLPVETVIEAYNEETVAEAIRREAARGGQVFYLHNKIGDLWEVRRKLETLAPELLIETAHGQMDPRDLESIMHRFIHGGFHILIATTIIENGIDIPNVNTIIIDRADKYGLSQLYQLRGRVGRSDRLAYAYLFYPPDEVLTESAMKRLHALSDCTELGSGFKIAMRDMEIRGAGNLLGREQSGDIYSVGFDMYMRILDEAVQRLENADYAPESETLLELEYSGFIPDSYIDSPQTKMEFYKKIAAARERADKERLFDELFDRFGPVPDEVASLLSLAEIRIICRELGVSSLREKAGLARIVFSKVANVNADRIVRMIWETAGKVRLDPKQPNAVILATGNIGLKEKSEFIREKLASLKG
jgi:transcription-repair coupling factor (superfamily II helicase)